MPFFGLGLACQAKAIIVMPKSTPAKQFMEKNDSLVEIVFKRGSSKLSLRVDPFWKGYFVQDSKQDVKKAFPFTLKNILSSIFKNFIRSLLERLLFT